MSDVSGYVWARESNQHDNEIYSLTVQLETCLEMAQKDGVHVPRSNIFKVQFSGVNLWAIPQLTELRAVLQSQPGRKVVYVYAQDRLVRGEQAEDVFWLLVEFRRYQAEVRFHLNPLDLSTIAGKIQMLVAGHEASGEIQKILDRTWTRGRLKRMQEGKIPNSGPAKYGYRRIKETGKAEIVEEQAVYIRKAADLLDEGYGAATIALRFTREGIPSPKGGAWSPNTIKQFFRDSAYKGEGYGWRYNRKKHGKLKGRARQDWVKLADDAYPPIIEPSRWDRLNAVINKNKGIKSRQSKQLWLLRGLVVCDLCEFPAYHVRSPNKNSPTDPKALIYRHYQCGRWQSERNAGKSRSCFAARANAPQLEASVWAKVCAFIRSPELLLERVRAAQPRAARDYGAEIDALERATAGKLSEIRRLAERLRTAPSVVASHIESEMVSAETERMALENQIAELRQKNSARTEFEKGLAGLSDLVTEIAGSLDNPSEREKRDVLDTLPLVYTLRGEIVVRQFSLDKSCA
jgi:DNA invertase Pin-like site-specific DNA recombinase